MLIFHFAIRILFWNQSIMASRNIGSFTACLIPQEIAEISQISAS